MSLTSSTHNSLVLSGGGMRGPWQLGVLAYMQRLIEAGHLPKFDSVVGVSVGAISASIIAHEGGDLAAPARLWLKHVKKPSDLFRNKSMILRIVPGVVRNSFNGLIDNSPLRDLIHKHIDPLRIKDSSIKLAVGAVNISSGKTYFARNNSFHFLEYLLASTSIPFIFPIVEINRAYYVDCGIVEIAPVDEAIRMGADNICVVMCHPEKFQPVMFNPRSLLELAERYSDIITSNIITSNLSNIEKVNSLLTLVGKLQDTRQAQEFRAVMKLNDKKLLSRYVIRPSEDFHVTVRDPDIGTIPKLINLGAKEASDYYFAHLGVRVDHIIA